MPRGQPLAVPPPRSTRFGSPLVLSRVHWVRQSMISALERSLSSERLSTYLAAASADHAAALRLYVWNTGAA